MDLQIDPFAVRRAADVLQRHGAGLAAAGRLAAAGEGDRIWGGDRLGRPFGAAYPGARDAVLARVQALAGVLASTGNDLAGVADRTEHADAESAAAFLGGG